jgi:hypothetical protein
LNDKKKQYEEMQYEKAKIIQEYNEKIGILRSKGT